MVTMDSIVLPLFPNGTIEKCDHYLAPWQIYRDKEFVHMT